MGLFSFHISNLCTTLQILCWSKSDTLHSSFIITQIFDILHASGICSLRLMPSSRIKLDPEYYDNTRKTAIYICCLHLSKILINIYLSKPGLMTGISYIAESPLYITAETLQTVHYVHHLHRLSEGLLSETNSLAPRQGGMIGYSGVGSDISTHH